MVTIPLQRDGNKAKAYQVHQVRKVIMEHNLGGMFLKEQGLPVPYSL